MSKEFEGTQGKWDVGFGDGITGIRAAASCYWDETDVHYIPVRSGRLVVAYVIRAANSDPIADADASLIAEAGTVLHETGLTPRQLAEQRAVLLEALVDCRRALEIANFTQELAVVDAAIALAQGDAA